MTANWRVVRNTLVWLFIAVMTMGLVIASPYVVKSNAASPTSKVTVAKASNGKWGAVKNGKIDTSVTGVYQNSNGWWYVKKGYVQFDYNGIQKNSYGWWRIEKGKVNFKAAGVYQNEYGWWRVENGKVNFKANEIYKNAYGWWKTTNGKVTFKENGVFKNSLGWWYVKNSKVDFNYNGLASNSYGTWYIYNGKVDFDYNGTYADGDKYYIITNGKASPMTEEQYIAVEAARKAAIQNNVSRAYLVYLLQEQKEYSITEELATFAVDNAGIDFDSECLLKALDYLGDFDEGKYAGVSRAFLVRTLDEVDQFTDDNIRYAMNAIDKDVDANFWNNQAVAAANNAVKEAGDTKPSKDDVKKVLTEVNLFTDAEADYAVAHIEL